MNRQPQSAGTFASSALAGVRGYSPPEGTPGVASLAQVCTPTQNYFGVFEYIGLARAGALPY
jgi:hypothetical protein